MNATLFVIALASLALMLTTCWAYERLAAELRADVVAARRERDRAIRHAEDSQVLLDAVVAESAARRRHPAGTQLPRLVRIK